MRLNLPQPRPRLRPRFPLRAALGLPLAALMLASPALAEPAARSITISGTGAVSRAPDMARMTIGVTSFGATAAEALGANSAQQSAVIELLKQAGIPASDMQTSGLNIGPQYDPSTSTSTPTPQSYRAANMLEVRITDLGNLGAILDGAISTGATNFGGLSFGLSDPRDAETEARKLAVADARAKAELYAAELGAKLGPALRLSESNGYGGGPVMELARSAAMAAPVETGEMAVTVQVTVEYALEAAE